MNGFENEKTPLERMNEGLYKPQRKMSDVVRPARTPIVEAPVARGGWEQETVSRKPAPMFAPSVIFLVAAALFFVVAAGIAAFLLITGSGSVSADKVDVQINKGQPTAISSGDAVPLLIEITNNNAVSLTNAQLTVNFPDGTYNPDIEGKLLPYQRINLGTIKPHEPIHQTVRARLFGMENQQLSIPVSLEYKTEGSNATFVKNETYTVTVSNSPIALEVKTVSDVSAGQDFTVVVTVRSNASTDIPNVVLKVAYPFGFSPSTGNPSIDANGIMTIGTLSPGQSKDITLHGALSGNEGDERVLRFSVGTSDTASKFVSYTEKSESVFITRPFLSVGLSLNRSTDDTLVVAAGSDINGTISIGNTLSDSIQDASVVLKLKGDIIDTGSIQVTNGFYSSSDQTIRFSKETIPGLANLNPGESVNGTFSFHLKSAAAVASEASPSALISVSASGNRSTAGNVSETLSSTITKTIQVQSSLQFTASLTHLNGSFKNTGPIPPVANTETTYTVLLSLKNGSNGIAEGKASMVLPSYVRFTNVTNPSGGAITYDETTRTVTWNAGDIASNQQVQGAFQVALLPSTSQHGTSPMVVSGIRFSGHDRFVDKDLTITAANLDTRTPNDSGYTTAGSQVQ